MFKTGIFCPAMVQTPDCAPAAHLPINPADTGLQSSPAILRV